MPRSSADPARNRLASHRLAVWGVGSACTIAGRGIESRGRSRDGIGTGFGRVNSIDSAHEIALKAAETDATKRALATFGNPFGLALYDKDLANVTRAPVRTTIQQAPTLVLHYNDGSEAKFDSPRSFAGAVLAQLIGSLDALL